MYQVNTEVLANAHMQKIKSLCLIQHHGMKMYEVVEA
jgi:hypothetical protein